MFSRLAFGTTTTQIESPVAADFHVAVQPNTCSAANERDLMAGCRHEVPDGSGHRCAAYNKCLHRDIINEVARATCRDCNRTFIAWWTSYRLGWEM